VALKVKPLSDAVKYWEDGARARADRYAAEAKAAAELWQTNAEAAAKLYRDAVTAPNIEQMFKGGISRVGAAKYRRKVEAVGAARFAPGISAAKPDYESGVAPFLETLAALVLPARKPRGDPANIDRVAKIATELHKKRLAIRAIG